MPAFANGTASLVWVIISAVLAVVGGLVLYFTFLSKKNEGKFKGFWNWMQEFLTFKKMFIEHFLKVTYLILAIFVTLASFSAGHFLWVILGIILGNLVLRISYEFSLVLLLICRNTTEINNKMSCKEAKKENKAE